MQGLYLKEITRDDFYSICRLSETLTPAQQRCVASNSYSIAEASYYPGIAWFRAIYLDETPIGFVMLELDDSDDREEGEVPSIFLWRFMIARDYQRSGYGKKVLDLIVQKCKDENIFCLETSVDLGEESPYDFYIKYGFLDTGRKIECGELVLSLNLQET